MKRAGKVLEDTDEDADYSDGVIDALQEAAKQTLLDVYAAYGIKIPSFNILHGNSYMFPFMRPYALMREATLLYALEGDGLNPSSTTVNDVFEVLDNKNSNTNEALKEIVEPYVHKGIYNFEEI